MKSQSRSAPDVSSRLGAGVAGAGSGTFLVALAAGLPPDSVMRPWLQFAAPTVSVFAGALATWAYVALQTFLREREVKGIIIAVRKKVYALESDPSASEELKKEARQKREELEKLSLERDMERVRLLAPIKPAQTTRVRMP